MKIFKAKQVQEIDSYTIENEPVSSIDLMERASKAFSFWFIRHFDISNKIVVFAGPGNNGGDALAISRMLVVNNFRVAVYVVRISSKITDECNTNFKRFKTLPGAVLHDLNENDPFPVIQPGSVIIDGLFGSGLSRPVTGFPARVIEFINESALKVVSIDIPSGLFTENNSENNSDAIIKADYTITFQFPFLSFFFAENYQYTGEWKVIDIGLHKEIMDNTDTDHYYLSQDFIRRRIKVREKFSHKGNFGHALIISGSYGMMGAAVIAAKACLRGGAGLVTAHVPYSGYEIMQTAVPEALVSLDKSGLFVSEIPGLENINAVGIGPGLSLKADKNPVLQELFSIIKVPLVIDADALNILSLHKEWYSNLPVDTILTPHAKEFDRLAGNSKSMYERHIKQIEFAKKYGVIIILKGAYTITTLPDGRSYFNTTGNPGMATGGSGDVLTGLIVSLLAQSYEPGDAALIAVYIHGLAADIASGKISQQALIAGDIIDYLGKAFLALTHRKSVFR